MHLCAELGGGIEELHLEDLHQALALLPLAIDWTTEHADETPSLESTKNGCRPEATRTEQSGVPRVWLEYGLRSSAEYPSLHCLSAKNTSRNC